jgi:prepilin-type N-terminal cleavage/methylation domain-containing protein
MMQRKNQSGFSAIELLITLFVAVAFIAAGYELYIATIKSGGDARQRTTANNIAYDNLRRYAPQATAQCSNVTPSPTPTIPAGSGLPSASITVTISCPYGVSTALSKIQVSVKYGTPQQEVLHATYTNGS